MFAVDQATSFFFLASASAVLSVRFIEMKEGERCGIGKGSSDKALQSSSFWQPTRNTSKCLFYIGGHFLLPPFFIIPRRRSQETPPAVKVSSSFSSWCHARTRIDPTDGSSPLYPFSELKLLLPVLVVESQYSASNFSRMNRGRCIFLATWTGSPCLHLKMRSSVVQPSERYKFPIQIWITNKIWKRFTWDHKEGAHLTVEWVQFQIHRTRQSQWNPFFFSN